MNLTSLNPYGISFPSGTLKIRPQSASISSEVPISGSLFCKVRFGGGLQETAPDKKNKRNPLWNQELSFRRKNEDTFKMEVCSLRFLLAPIIVGECCINLETIFTRGSATIRSELFYKGKNTGFITVMVKWEPDNALPTYQSVPRSNSYIVPPQNVYSANNTTYMNAVPLQSSHSYDDRNSLYLQHGDMVIQFPGASTYVNMNRSNPQQMQNSNFRPVSGNLSHSQPQLNQSSASNLVASRGLNPGQEVVEEGKDEEPIDPNLPDEQKCVVCLERKKGGAFYRCGHNCCCVTCGKRFIGAPCPICRQVVLDFIRVFDS